MSKNVLITGAGRPSGIGYAVGRELSLRGHRVFLTTHTVKQRDEMRKMVKQVRLHNMTVEKLDVTDWQDREYYKNKRIDVLINNAAVGQSGPLAEIPLERLQQSLETNVTGAIALSQIALGEMLERDSGTVIFISSLAARTIMPFTMPYGITKHALSAAAIAMRKEIYEIVGNVHVSVVEPGAYHTGFNQRMFDTKHEWLNNSSRFYLLMEPLSKYEKNIFRRVERKSLQSIVKRIVAATEADAPRARYSAPLWQDIYVHLKRFVGW